MQTVLVAVKDRQKRAQIVSSLRAVRPDCSIRQTDVLEDVMSLTRLTTPDVLITTLDEQRHETLRLLDDLQISAPQVSVVVTLGVMDFELLSHAVRSGGADYLLYPFKDAQLERLLTSIEEREKALFESEMFTGTLAREAKTPAQQAAEAALHALLLGREAQVQALACPDTQRGAYLVLAHGNASHELLCAYLSGAHTLYDARIPERDASALLVYLKEDQGARWVRAKLLAALSHLRHGGYPTVDIGVSGPVEDVENALPTAISQARTALSFQFYEQGGSLTFYEDIARDLTRDATISAAAQSALLQAVDIGAAPAIRAALHRIFMQLSWPQCRPALVLRALNRLCVRLEDHGAHTQSIQESLQENLCLAQLEHAFERALAGGDEA